MGVKIEFLKILLHIKIHVVRPKFTKTHSCFSTGGKIKLPTNWENL